MKYSNGKQWSVSITDLTTFERVDDDYVGNEFGAKEYFHAAQRLFLETRMFSVLTNAKTPDVALVQQFRSNQAFMIELCPPVRGWKLLITDEWSGWTRPLYQTAPRTVVLEVAEMFIDDIKRKGGTVLSGSPDANTWQLKVPQLAGPQTLELVEVGV
jgi:hypothetical protein